LRALADGQFQPLQEPQLQPRATKPATHPKSVLGDLLKLEDELRLQFEAAVVNRFSNAVAL
jgi:hypothetical protein